MCPVQNLMRPCLDVFLHIALHMVHQILLIRLVQFPQVKDLDLLVLPVSRDHQLFVLRSYAIGQGTAQSSTANRLGKAAVVQNQTIVQTAGAEQMTAAFPLKQTHDLLRVLEIVLSESQVWLEIFQTSQIDVVRFRLRCDEEMSSIYFKFHNLYIWALTNYEICKFINFTRMIYC